MYLLFLPTGQKVWKKAQSLSPGIYLIDENFRKKSKKAHLKRF